MFFSLFCAKIFSVGQVFLFSTCLPLTSKEIPFPEIMSWDIAMTVLFPYHFTFSWTFRNSFAFLAMLTNSDWHIHSQVYLGQSVDHCRFWNVSSRFLQITLQKAQSTMSVLARDYYCYWLVNNKIQQYFFTSIFSRSFSASLSFVQDLYAWNVRSACNECIIQSFFGTTVA